MLAILDIDGTNHSLPTDTQAGEPNIWLKNLHLSIFSTGELQFATPRRHCCAPFDKNAEVVLYLDVTDDGAHYRECFHGDILKRGHHGVAGAENITFVCYDLIARLNHYPWVHDGFDRVVWNSDDPDDEDYDATLSGTVSDCLAQYWTDTATDLQANNIHAITLNLNMPAVSPKNLSFMSPTGGVEIIDSLLRWIPGFYRWLKLDQTGAHEHDVHINWVSEMVSRDLTIGGENWVISHEREETIADAYTAIQFTGRREQTDQMLYYDPADPTNSTLQPDWDSEDEATWDPTKHENSDVFKKFKGKTLPAKWAKSSVRACPGCQVGCWAEGRWYIGSSGPQTVRYLRSMQEFDSANKTFTLSWPAYKSDESGGYEAVKVWLRLVTLGAPVSVRVPTEGYQGDAYTQDGVQNVYRNYREKLVKTTLTGTVTEANTGGLIRDAFSGLRSFQLVGCKVTFNATEYTITSNGNNWIQTDGSFSSSIGDGYSVSVADTTDQYGAIATALIDGMSASPAPTTLVRHDIASSLLLLWPSFATSGMDDMVKVNLLAADGHTTGWETAGLVVSEIDLDFQANRVTLTLDTESSIAKKSLEDIESQNDLQTRLEEVEIMMSRRSTPQTDVGSDPNSGLTNSDAGVRPHAHTDVGGAEGDGGQLDLEETLFSKDSHDGPLDDGAAETPTWEWTWMGLLGFWRAPLLDHEHSDTAGDGGVLSTLYTHFNDGVYTGLTALEWDAVAEEFTIAGIADHIHDGAAGSGGRLSATDTEWSDGTHTGILGILWSGTKFWACWYEAT